MSSASPSDATTYDVAYTCAVCSATTVGKAIGLTPPRELRSEKSVEVLRQTRAVLGAEPGDLDPVEDVDLAILEDQAKLALKYATCPSCKAKNPEGVAAAKSEARAGKIGVAGLFAAVAIGAFFAPAVAYVPPALALFILVMRIVVARKTRQPLPALAYLTSVAFIGGSVAVVVYFPRFASLAPAVLAIWSALARSTSETARFEQSSEQLRFQGLGYRDAP